MQALLFIFVAVCSATAPYGQQPLKAEFHNLEANGPDLVLRKDSALLKKNNGSVTHYLIRDSPKDFYKQKYMTKITLSVPSMVEGKLYDDLIMEDTMALGPQFEVIGNKAKKVEFVYPLGIQFIYKDTAPDFTLTVGQISNSKECGCPVQHMSRKGPLEIYSFDTIIPKSCGNFACGFPSFNFKAPVTFYGSGTVYPGDKFYIRAGDGTKNLLDGSKETKYSFPGNMNLTIFWVAGPASGDRTLRLKHEYDKSKTL